MERQDQEVIFDFRPLVDASATLLGYFVHTWFVKYLEVAAGSLRRLHDAGLIEDIATPTEPGRHVLFDFGALQMERLSYAVGIYLYVLSCHKRANRLLMNRQDVRQVLYLRGYDFEGSVAAAGGIAMGFSSTHTQQFGARLRELIGGTFPIFKVMSPKDVWWETIDAQRYFNGDFGRLVALARQRPASVYLNALSWQQSVLRLIERTDHYVVYVSSITESVMWEIEQLDTDERRGRVTIVFDEEAIANKEFQLGMRDRMQDEYGDRLIWRKEGELPATSVGELRGRLAAKFHVTTPEEFAADIDRHRERIAASAGPLSPGQRETWIDFEWRPAVPEDQLEQLRAISDAASDRIAAAIRDGIASLPLFLADLNLRLFMTLLMGEHADTGRALAAYGAVMQGALDYYEPPGERVGSLSEENREGHLALLRDHADYAAYAGVRLVGYGRSHEFEDRSEAATAETAAIFDATKCAVDDFFARVGGPIPATRASDDADSLG